MTKTIIIVCDWCDREMKRDGWYVSYVDSQIEALNRTLHFCDYEHMRDYLIKKTSGLRPLNE